MIAHAVRVTMGNHTYSYNGESHLQKLWAPIGDAVLAAVARAVMLDWNIQFLSLTNNLSNQMETVAGMLQFLCLLYKRYVDDQLGAHVPPPPRYVFNPANQGSPV